MTRTRPVSTISVALASLASVMFIARALTAILAMLCAGKSNPAWQVRPVSIFAGWLTAACRVATGVAPGGPGTLGHQGAALAMLAAVLAVAVWVQSLLPFEWALAGVIAATLTSGNWPVIAVAAFGIMAPGFGFAPRRMLRLSGTPNRGMNNGDTR